MSNADEHLIIVLMGVCGCGKTTIGEALAEQLQWPLYDGDDFHPPANVEKMRQGTPLTDEDRLPWLQILADEMGKCLAQGQSALLACSALKQHYRDILVAGRDQIRIVHLKGDKELIQQRLARRQHRYMPASLLDSQFAALEAPRDAIEVDISPDPQTIARHIKEQLGI